MRLRSGHYTLHPLWLDSSRFDCLVEVSKWKTAVIVGRIEMARSPAETLKIGTFTEPLACLVHYGTLRRLVSLGLVPWFLGAAGLRSASSNPPTHQL